MVGLAASALASLVAAVYGDPCWGMTLLAVLLLAQLLVHLHARARLMRWLRGDAAGAPRLWGAWGRMRSLVERDREEASRRHAELEEGLARWREAASALPDGVVILDADRISWCNDIAREHLEIDPSRDAGARVSHLPGIPPEFLGYLEGGDFSKPLQVRAPRSERVLSLLAVAYGEGQRLVLSRDVTQFQQVERVRREFVANVSHELRTPLTVVSGFVETLRDEPDAEARARYLDLMGQQSDRMLRLVEDLLTLSSLESSPPPPMDDRVDMDALVERLGAEARALSGGRHRIEIEAAAGLDLLGSEKELASAFGNLVSNAIRYTPDGGRVHLGWRATAEGAAFDVEDTGLGISAEHIARITERFYRVDRGRSRETGGTGLGLAIVKHALNRHGAALHIESTPGRGSLFSARFAGPRVRGNAG
jgi:two-component system phosphate regulon sensor histidine kinase PhoR